jgi:nicotinamide riboside transporter PnuC
MGGEKKKGSPFGWAAIACVILGEMRWVVFSLSRELGERVFLWENPFLRRVPPGLALVGVIPAVLAVAGVALAIVARRRKEPWSVWVVVAAVFYGCVQAFAAIGGIVVAREAQRVFGR